MGTILVQISDRKWTMRAMHLACAMARNTNSRLVLLHLMRARSPYLLGAAYGVEPPSRHELDAINEYDSIAEDYGLEVTLQPMQYESFPDAIVQATEHTGASMVFAHVPESVFTLWHKVQLWNLRRQLTALNCQLYTLDGPQQSEEWALSVSLRATK